MSLPVRVIAIEVSSFMLTACAVATGASLTGLTVIETVAAAELTVPSLTVKVKLSGPW